MESRYPPNISAENLKGIRFLSACPNGIYLAFWSDTNNSFNLIDVCGNQIWHSYISAEKALPHGILSSMNGVSCLFDFEFLPGIFYCDFDQGYSTIFGCSSSPIGYDTNLQYFAVSSCDPHEGEFFEYEENTGRGIKLTPQTVTDRLRQGPLLMNRNRHILSFPRLPVDRWDGLVMQTGKGGIERFVILNKGDLQWISLDENEPAITVKDCVPEKDKKEFFRCTFEACEDNALIQSKTRAIVVNRVHGVVLRASDLTSVALKGQRILAQYASGAVEVTNSDGSLQTRQQPPYAYWTVAANIVDNELKIASYHDGKYRFEIQTIDL
jgi:hypothetical protein